MACNIYQRCGAPMCTSSSASSSRKATVAAAAAAKQPQHHQQQRQPQQLQTRRQLLQSAALLAAPLLFTQRSAADVADIEAVLPGEPLPPPALPKTYQRTMHKLVRALQTAIQAEASGAKEAEVRRKADPAKELVKEFVGKWQDQAEVVGDVTHDEMKSAIAELGRFYQVHGPRSRLSEEAKQSVLAHLAEVEAALPEEEKSLLGF